MLLKDSYMRGTNTRGALDFTRSTPRPKVANRLITLALVLTGLVGVLVSLGVLSL